MDAFIETFDTSTGCISSLSKTFDQEMFFQQKYQNVEIKSIGSKACFNGKVTSIDMSNTKITRISSYAFKSCQSLKKNCFPCFSCLY